MLSSNKVVSLFKMMYTDTCTITEHQKVKEDGIATFEDVVVAEDIPCRISYASSSTGDGDADSKSQQITLFMSNNQEVKEGSKLSITRNGKTVDYIRASQPKLYDAHQQIELELFERWM